MLRRHRPTIGYIPSEPDRPSQEAKWLTTLLNCNAHCLNAPQSFNLTRNIGLPSLDQLQGAVVPLLAYPWIMTEGTGGFLWASILRYSGFQGGVTILPYINPNCWHDVACLAVYRRFATANDRLFIGSSRSGLLYNALGVTPSVGEPYGIDGGLFSHCLLSPEFSDSVPPRPYLIFAGRIHPDKAVHQLLRVVLKARLLFPNLITVLATHNVDAEYYSFLSPFLNDSTNGIVLVRSPTAKQLAALYNGASAFVTAAISYYETFGRAPLEALASGTPAIAPRYDGFADTLHQPGGTLIDTIRSDVDVEADEHALLRAVYDCLTSQPHVSAAEISRHACARYDRVRTIHLLDHLLFSPPDPDPLCGEYFPPSIELPSSWIRRLLDLAEMSPESALRSVLNWEDDLSLFDHDREFRATIRRFLADPTAMSIDESVGSVPMRGAGSAKHDLP